MTEQTQIIGARTVGVPASIGPVDFVAQVEALVVEIDPELAVAYDFFLPDVENTMGALIRRGTDEVIATARTRRWSLDQCNNQEKAYLGVNLENLVRVHYDLAEGRVGMDFDVQGVDVDAKWSRRFGGWQIPTEAVDHICLLIHGDDITGEMAVGLLRIRDEILVGGNKDSKRTIQSPGGIDEIRWLVRPGTRLPENFFMSLRKEDRDAILAPRGGNERARELFKRCEGLLIERSVIAAIAQQLDDARRFRGETRASLAKEGFEVLNGHWKAHRARAMELGGFELRDSSEWVCLRSDGSTSARRAKLEPIRQAEAAEFRREFKRQITAANKERRDNLNTAKAEARALANEAADLLALREAEYDDVLAVEAVRASEKSAVESAKLF